MFGLGTEPLILEDLQHCWFWTDIYWTRVLSLNRKKTALKLIAVKQMESMTIGFLIFSCLKKKDRCFNIQILADSRTEGESDPSSQGLILHTAIPRPKSCTVLAANFSGSKNRKQMATFHAEEWSFWLNLVKSSSTLSNYFTVIMKKYLHNSKAYQQYADQKYHANLLTHGSMYSALQITSDSICQNVTLKSEKSHTLKEWSLYLQC